jgi:hypothetical protein
MVLTPIVAVDAIRRGPSRISGFGRVACGRYPTWDVTLQ